MPYFDSGRDLRFLVVTSALPGEGKTTVATHLAMTEAGTGFRVLLIEADLRRAAIAEAEGLRPRPGLAEVLTGQSAIDQAVQQATDRPNRGQAKRHLA